MRTLKKRRNESKTDYAKRLKMLESGKPRLVFRKTNKYIIGQYVASGEIRDKIEMGINSKQLLKYGWPEEFRGSLKSMPASYLAGFLIGNKIKKKKLETPIADLGMNRIVHKSKIFAFLKGVADSGIPVKTNEKTFPDEDRIKGKNLKKDFSKTFDLIKSKIGAEK